MSTSITATEDALIGRARALLGARVRGVESLPGDWDDEMLGRLQRFVPGVYVVFEGGSASALAGQTQAGITSTWSMLVCTGHASGEAARRRGDAQQAGAYELVTALVAGLHGWLVPDVGALTLSEVTNLYTGTIEGKGLAVYRAAFALPMTFDPEPAAAELAAFVTFDAQYDTPPQVSGAEHRKWLGRDYSTSKPDGEDVVTLPQP